MRRATSKTPQKNSDCYLCCPQMTANCRTWLLEGEHHEQLWEREPIKIIPMLQYCLRLNDAYHEQYRMTRQRLLAIPKGKQLDVSEQDIFGRMDLFCRRLQKLITMVSALPFRCSTTAGSLCLSPATISVLNSNGFWLYICVNALIAYSDSILQLSSSSALPTSGLKAWTRLLTVSRWVKVVGHYCAKE